MPLQIARFLIFISFLSCSCVYGQVKELGFTVGGMYYLGELNQKQFSNLQPAIGITKRTTYQKRVAWEQHLIVGRVNGADSLQNDPALRNRNLSFRSNIVELGTQLEINYFEYEKGSKKNFATPYIFFGVSAFYSNPQAMYNNKWYNLRDVGTEGQTLSGGKKYNLINFAIPMGIGFKVSLGGRVSIAIFSGYRKTFSDYVDDVGGTYADPSLYSPENAVFVDRSFIKQRPNGTNTGLDRSNNNTNDWYNYTGFSVSFKTNKIRSACDRVY